MSDNTPIEWTDVTASLWLGCTQISEGGAHCYPPRQTTPTALANLPQRFSIDIHDWQPEESKLDCLSPKMQREMWQLMRAELIRRGYRVIEHFCYDRQVHVADCVRETRIAP